MPLRPRMLLAGVAAAALAATLTPAWASAASAQLPTANAASAAGPDKTSKVEAERVDRVPTPKLGWYGCYSRAECATAKVPLDYDDPTGKQVELALLRVKATDQKHKIGTLFVNPGGPGGQGTELAYYAPYFLSDSVLKKFDIVGFDPRGIGFSDNVKCFRSNGEQADAFKGLNVWFPYTKAEEKAYISSSKKVGKACSSTGKDLASAMSTGEVARDMDVLRRAVGDKKLSYLGFSYGTALGQYYANMFPDRVRAVVADGVINPISWTGTAPGGGDQILDERLRSADGAYKALHEILVRCDKAGGLKCEFAGGDPVANFELVAQRLRKAPVDIDGTTFSYADFIGIALIALYDPTGYGDIMSMAQDLLVLTEPPASLAANDARARAAQHLRKIVAEHRAKRPTRDFPYDNGGDAFFGVICTDGLHPKDAGAWPALTAKADERAPYFGRAWAWSTSPCASNTWTAHDEDAYTGPFNRRTASPVLFVGDYYDPATNYDEAVSSSKLLPGSRLVSSDSWGHTAYGTSKCVTNAVDAYLVKLKLPKVGIKCVGDIQPFVDSPEGARKQLGQLQLPAAGLVAEAPVQGDAKILPPVAAPSALLK